ncbi:MAG: hypothetical protein QX203_17715, partial [Methylococcaceae bacterium]
MVTPSLSFTDNTSNSASYPALAGINNNQVTGVGANSTGVVGVIGSYSSITVTPVSGVAQWYTVQVAQKTVTGQAIAADNNSIISGTSSAVDHSGNELSSFATQALLNSAIASGLDGGAGMDTLKLAGNYMALDLTQYSSTPGLAIPVNNYEKFDLSVGGHNSLTMSVNDVLNAGQTDAFQSNGRTQVMVNGDGTDSVTLRHLLNNGGDTGTWIVKGTQVIAGITYNVIDHTTLNAEVLVQQGVNLSGPAIGGTATQTTVFPKIAGNVLPNDTDQDGTVQALKVDGVSATNMVTPGQGIDSSIEGKYGHLTVHPDGTYSYLADKSSGISAAVDDVFYYINKDANGADSVAPAKLTIHVTPPFASTASISSPSVTEGGNLDFTVTTSASPTVSPLSFVLNGISASIGQDTGSMQVNFGNGWQAVVGGVVNEPANMTQFQLRVPTIDDAIVELRETFTLAGSSNGASAVSGTGTIIDNDFLSGIATGVEDTPLTLTWGNFNLNSLPNAASSITVSSLPADGVLKLNNAPVTVGQVISQAAVNADQLIFTPDSNESGINAYHAPGVGNMKNDYAQLSFSATDSNANRYDGKMTLDIAPKADLGTLAATLVMNQAYIYTGNIPAAFGVLQPGQACVDKITFTTSGASPDTDGSEGATKIGLTNLVTDGVQVTVFDMGFNKIAPSADGLVYVDVNTPYYIVTPYYHVSLDYAVYRQEINSSGTALDQAYTGAQHYDYISPLILDLNGDGVQTTNVLDNGVNFDLNATGQKISSGWVSKEDGLLAIDLNGDGNIDSGAELFGTASQLADGSKAQDGFQALAALDGNRDGKID